MLNNSELLKLHTNQRLLVTEMQSRGIDVKIIYKDIELIKAEYEKHIEWILDRDSSITPYSVSIICGDDEAKTVSNEITLPIQFNGKLKATILIEKDEDESSIKEKVHNAIDSKLGDKSIVKEIYVKNKIYNIVVK